MKQDCSARPRSEERMVERAEEQVNEAKATKRKPGIGQARGSVSAMPPSQGATAFPFGCTSLCASGSRLHVVDGDLQIEPATAKAKCGGVELWGSKVALGVV
jgi:hypothetical protein